MFNVSKNGRLTSSKLCYSWLIRLKSDLRIFMFGKILNIVIRPSTVKVAALILNYLVTDETFL